MDGPENVISFEAHRRRRSTAHGEEPNTTAEPKHAPAAVPGKLTWLHCSSCGTLEYTEQFSPGGRVHNRCGSKVEEAILDVDARAEYTIAQYNLERIRTLTGYLEAQRRRYEEYQERLRRMVGDPGQYPMEQDGLAALPVAEVDSLGLLMPTALARPERHFLREQPPANDDPETTAPEAAPPET